MEKLNLKINYLYNSAFIIETSKHYLIFDYYLDDPISSADNLSKGVIRVNEFSEEKDILVFASHSHGDHYSPLIFDWERTRGDIKYILSSDIVLKNEKANIHMISPYEEIVIEHIRIKAFGSTDLGVSFLINVEGKNIFHAGDLNWWHWWDEPDKDNKNAEKMFKQEIEKLKGNQMDLAFFPVDPRLKEFYYLGPQYFVKQLSPAILIPMHFREDYKITETFCENFKELETKLIEIDHRGQEIIL